MENINLKNYDAVMKFVSDRTVTKRFVNGVNDVTEFDRARERLRELRVQNAFKDIPLENEEVRLVLIHFLKGFACLVGLSLFCAGLLMFLK